MLKFLRRLFGKDEKPAEVIEEDIDIRDLEAWINKRIESSMDDLHEEIVSIWSGIAQDISNAEEKVNVLEKAELQNKSIPKKVLHIMEGNRSAYIKKMRDFLLKVRLSYDDYDSIKKSIADFGKEIGDLNRATDRSYRVMQEFFSHESGDVASAIGRIARKMDNIGDIMRGRNIDALSGLKERASGLFGLIRQKEEIDEKIAHLDSEKKSIIKDIWENQKKMDELRSSDDYLIFEKLKEEKQAALDKKKSLNDVLKAGLLQAGPGLRKYERIALDNRLIQEYLDDPFEAVVKDEGLKIADVLESLKTSLEKSQIDIKDKKKERILKALSGFSKESLAKIASECREAKRSRAIVEENISKSRIMHAFEDLDYRRSHLKSKLEAAEKEIAGLERSRGKIDISASKDSLVLDIEKATGIRPAIKWAIAEI